MKRLCKLKASIVDNRDHVHDHVHDHNNNVPHPDGHDMRNEMPPVLDQKEIGSCSANAMSNILRHLLKFPFQPSRLFMYFNTRVKVEGSSPSDDSGCCLRDVCKAVQRFHVCDELVWPYDVSQFAICPPPKAYVDAEKHRVLRYAIVPQDLDAIRRTLAGHLPILMGIQLYESFMSDNTTQTGQVTVPHAGEECLGGHAVILCGYDDARSVFLIQNSWGPDVGMDGYFELPYKYVLDPNLTSDLWVVKEFK